MLINRSDMVDARSVSARWLWGFINGGGSGWKSNDGNFNKTSAELLDECLGIDSDRL